MNLKRYFMKNKMKLRYVYTSFIFGIAEKFPICKNIVLSSPFGFESAVLSRGEPATIVI